MKRVAVGLNPPILCSDNSVLGRLRAALAQARLAILLEDSRFDRGETGVMYDTNHQSHEGQLTRFYLAAEDGAVRGWGERALLPFAQRLLPVGIRGEVSFHETDGWAWILIEEQIGSSTITLSRTVSLAEPVLNSKDWATRSSTMTIAEIRRIEMLVFRNSEALAKFWDEKHFDKPRDQYPWMA